MTVLARIVKAIFVALFVEAILFAPMVLMVALAGNEVIKRILGFAVGSTGSPMNPATGEPER